MIPKDSTIVIFEYLIVLYTLPAIDLDFRVSQTTFDFEIITSQFFLTHFSPVSHFYTPRKRQETFSFPTFSGAIEMRHWTKIG